MIDDRPLEDWEYPEPDECEDEHASETRSCPSCGTAAYEDAEQCPTCGEYIVFADTAASGWSWWVVALGLLGVGVVILTMSLGW